MRNWLVLSRTCKLIMLLSINGGIVIKTYSVAIERDNLVQDIIDDYANNMHDPNLEKNATAFKNAILFANAISDMSADDDMTSKVGKGGG